MSDEGQRLRSSSPFVGTLTPEERLEILAACEQRATADLTGRVKARGRDRTAGRLVVPFNLQPALILSFPQRPLNSDCRPVYLPPVIES
jgi:hypothetical protein